MRASQPPSDRTLSFRRSVRTRENGRVLIGGDGLRVLRLSEAGAGLVRSWLRGAPVEDRESHQALAERLISAGLAQPQPLPTTEKHPRTLEVVVPCRDDDEHLRATLRALLPTSGDPDAVPAPLAARVTVVDDGSSVPISVASSECAPVSVVRREVNGGPAAARNTGWRSLADTDTDTDTGTDTDAAAPDIVAFVDAGVCIGERTLMALARHFTDPQVAAVAPRVRSADSTVSTGRADAIAEYEQRHSPLDLGSQSADARPTSPVAFVPAACLLVRRSALEAVEGFDEELRFGEDVDLVWRLREAGHVVRYDATLEATHLPRTSLRSFVKQRFGYGSAAGALARRHGAALAPFATSRWSLPIIGAVVTGHPVVAIAVACAYVPPQAKQLGQLPDARVEAARFIAAGNLAAVRSFAHTATRVWWPFTALVALTPLRRSAAIATAISVLPRLGSSRTPDAFGLALSILDDLAYGAGVWHSVLKHRRWEPLRPMIT